MELPTDLIVGILVRLPVKDVFVSKSVCKSWYALISNPNFTRDYAENTPFSTVIIPKYLVGGNKSLSLFEFSADGKFTEMPFTPKLPPDAGVNTGSDISSIALCNGSVFLSHRIRFHDHEIHKVYQWNPFWGSCVKALEHKCTYSSVCPWVYKAACIPYTDTYKLVRIRLTRMNVEGSAEIFTVGFDKSWRVLDDPLNFWDLASPDFCCFNGTFHWTKKESSETICTFGILDEKSGPVISKPPGNLRRSSIQTRLGVYKDRLSLIDQPSYSEMVIWTMKEYGVTESWSIDVVLRFDTPTPKAFETVCYFRIAVLPNGHVLIRKHDEVVTGVSERLIIYSFGNQASKTKVCGFELPFLYLHDLNNPSPNTFVPRFHPIEGR